MRCGSESNSATRFARNINTCMSEGSAMKKIMAQKRPADEGEAEEHGEKRVKVKAFLLDLVDDAERQFVDEWVTALQGHQIVTVQALQRRARDKQAWATMHDALASEIVTGGLASNLKQWKASQQQEEAAAQSPVSPPRLSGPELNLSVDNVLEWLRMQQTDSLKLNSRPFHYLKHDAGYAGNDRDGDVQLCGRERTITYISEKLKERRDHFEEQRSGQKAYPIPVCCGLSGIGKTRLLDEYPTFFERAGIAGATLGVLVHYANGHSKQLPALEVEAGFSWRLLHRVFLEENGPEFEVWYSTRVLPANGNELTLSVAVQAISKAAVATGLVDEGELLSLFIGIDEYQKLSTYSLRRLVERLQNCKSVGNVRIYPLFAGTDWRKGTIANSSSPDTKRAPLPLMLPREAEDAISSIPQWRIRLVNDEFRRQLFYLGGLPRAVVELGESNDFQDVWRTRVQNVWTMDDKSLIKLVAHAMSGLPVNPENSPELKVLVKGEDDEAYYSTEYSWRQLADMGVCILNDLAVGEDEPQFYVQVPYCVFRLASHIKGYYQGSLTERSLVQNLQILVKCVDHSTYATEPWQLWEVFGACFHALRINALQIIDVAECPFSWICDGANVNGCDFGVSLRPMQVRRLEEQIGPESAATLSEHDTHNQLPLFNGTADGVWFMFINGANGPALDVFFCLPLRDSQAVVFCGDQRKYSSEGLGQWRATDLLQAIRDQAPRSLPAGSRVVAALFSLFASFNVDADAEGALPADSFVVSFSEHSFYHGSLAYHPASSPCVDVNRCGVDKLRVLSSISRRAQEIVAQRPFASLQTFKHFCQDLSAEDAERVIVYGQQ